MQGEEFNPYQCHDNFIHGISFVSDHEKFQSEIHFDIDHIVEWLCPSTKEGETLFSVSKAVLKFTDARNLTLNIIWEENCFGDICIIKIEREKIENRPGYDEYYKWRIITHDKNDVITFEAGAMSLELIGEPKRVNRQYLLAEERT